MSPATEDCVVAAKHAESKHLRPPTAGTGAEAVFSSADDLVADLGMAGLNHADVLGGCLGEVEHTPSHEGAAIVDPDHDAPAVPRIRHLEFGAEPERLMGRGKKRRIHPFTRSSA